MAYVHRRTGKVYEQRIGSRVQVKRGKAFMTSGGLMASGIIQTKAGRYVSKVKSEWGKKHGKKQFEQSGYALFGKGGPGEVRKMGRRRA